MSTLDEQVAALKLPPMTDDELGRYLGLPSKAAAKIVAAIPAETRASYDHMRAVEVLIPRWQAGIDPYPSDVSVNRGRGRKRKTEDRP